MKPRAYYNEWEPYAAAWLRNLIAAGLIPDGDVDERSVTEVQASDLDGYTQCHFFAGIGGWSYALRLAGWPDDRPVWSASLPCQPFSAAGKAHGVGDERHLWPAFRGLVEVGQPATLFGEQVASKAGRLWLAGVRTDLETLGYAVGAADLCSTIRVPQQRERLFFVAHTPSTSAARRHSSEWRQRRPEEMATNRRYADWRESCEVGLLDDGISSRLAKAITKGFGNAIVPPVAAEFIGAYLDLGSGVR